VNGMNTQFLTSRKKERLLKQMAHIFMAVCRRYEQQTPIANDTIYLPL
jgi:hypothetical protein